MQRNSAESGAEDFRAPRLTDNFEEKEEKLEEN